MNFFSLIILQIHKFEDYLKRKESDWVAHRAISCVNQLTTRYWFECFKFRRIRVENFECIRLQASDRTVDSADHSALCPRTCTYIPAWDLFEYILRWRTNKFSHSTTTCWDTHVPPLRQGALEQKSLERPFHERSSKRKEIWNLKNIILYATTQLLTCALENALGRGK